MTRVKSVLSRIKLCVGWCVVWGFVVLLSHSTNSELFYLLLIPPSILCMISRTFEGNKFNSICLSILHLFLLCSVSGVILSRRVSIFCLCAYPFVTQNGHCVPFHEVFLLQKLWVCFGVSVDIVVCFL